MTVLFLVRHAVYEGYGPLLVGRARGYGLSVEGQRQAAALAARLASERITGVVTSPRERARETAAPIAERCDVPLDVAAELDEIDFGAWTGRSFANLHEEPLWQRWNTFRSGSRPPGGESMAEAQARALGRLDDLVVAEPDGRIVLVSHGDIIKALIAWFIGMPLDLMQRLEIAPASVSVLELQPWGPRLLSLNEVVG